MSGMGSTLQLNNPTVVAAVATLAAAGLALASGQRAVLRPAVALLLVLCAADWVLVQDLGVFGGLIGNASPRARGGQLSVWSLPSHGSGWSRYQVINVAIPYGSSG